MSSQELVRELLGLGLSRREIGRQLGRNDRLIGYVESGAKPGANLEVSLAALRDRLAGAGAAASPPPPPRRTTAGGRVARVRAPATRGASRWSSTTSKRQGTSSGARPVAKAIARAADNGAAMAFTLTVAPGVSVAKSGKRGGPIRGGKAQEVRIGEGREGLDADEWTERVEAAGGDVTQAVADYLNESGRAESISRDDIYSVELSTWGG